MTNIEPFPLIKYDFVKQVRFSCTVLACNCDDVERRCGEPSEYFEGVGRDEGVWL